MAGKLVRRIFAIILPVLLAACSSGIKSYPDATPLEKTQQDLAVRVLWSRELGPVLRNHHAQLPVVIQGDDLYYANISGEVGALRSLDNTSRWKLATGETLSAGPGVGAGLVLVGTRKAQLIALDQASGAERWRANLGAELLASPQVADDAVIVQTLDGKVLALAAASGQAIWSYSHSIPALTLRGTSTPVISGDAVLAGFADGRLVSLQRKTGKLQWTTAIAVPKGRSDLDRLVDIDGLFGVDQDTVFVASYQGNLAAVSVKNGSTLWAREFSSYTGLVVGAGKVFVSDAEGNVWALDQRTGGTLWRQAGLQGREPSLPVIGGGPALVVGDYEGYVHWLSLEDGHFAARQSLDHIWQQHRAVMGVQLPDDARWRSVSVYPLAAGNRLYVRDNFGMLTVFQVGGAAVQ